MADVQRSKLADSAIAASCDVGETGLLIGSPAQRNARRAREILIKLGGALKSDNIFELELTNRSWRWRLPRRFNPCPDGGWLDPGGRGRTALPDLITVLI